MQTQTKRDFVNKVTIKLKEFEKERQKRLKKLILINLFITVAIIIIYKISILCYTQNFGRFVGFWIYCNIGWNNIFLYEYF